MSLHTYIAFLCNNKTGLIKYFTHDLRYNLKPTSHSFTIFLKETALLDWLLIGEWKVLDVMLYKPVVFKFNCSSSKHLSQCECSDSTVHFVMMLSSKVEASTQRNWNRFLTGHTIVFTLQAKLTLLLTRLYCESATNLNKTTKTFSWSQTILQNKNKWLT